MTEDMVSILTKRVDDLTLKIDIVITCLKGDLDLNNLGVIGTLNKLSLDVDSIKKNCLYCKDIRVEERLALLEEGKKNQEKWNFGIVMSLVGTVLGLVAVAFQKLFGLK